MITTINEFKDYLKGGLSDNKTLNDIAKKHNVSIDELTKEFELGLKVELEHTNDENIAKEITMDHLYEMPNYYSELAKIEK